jgi:hypothetical protein
MCEHPRLPPGVGSRQALAHVGVLETCVLSDDGEGDEPAVGRDRTRARSSRRQGGSRQPAPPAELLWVIRNPSRLKTWHSRLRLSGQNLGRSWLQELRRFELVDGDDANTRWLLVERMHVVLEVEGLQALLDQILANSAKTPSWLVRESNPGPCTPCPAGAVGRPANQRQRASRCTSPCGILARGSVRKWPGELHRGYPDVYPDCNSDPLPS